MPLPKAATCRGKRPLRKPYWPGNARSAAETAICAAPASCRTRSSGCWDEATDNRRNYLNPVNAYDENWTPTLLGYCVNRSSSDRVSIRIAEMYLIAAEAGSYLPAELEKAKGYLLDLKAKRLKPEAMETQRTKVGAMDAEQLRTEIADERARELIGEGHRWMDLRRTTRPAIVKTYKDRTYTLNANDARYTLPFPQSAIDSNPELND